MPVELKQLSGGMDTDSSPYKLPKESYTDALNISHDAVEGSNDGVITNIIANRLVPYTYHSGGTPTIIGAKGNTLRGTIIELAFHPDGYHVIIEFNSATRIRTKIFENLTDSGGVDVLGFTKDGKITSIDIYNRDEGDLLFFLDSLGRPTGLDIEKFRNGVYTPVTRAILDKCKKPPLLQPSGIYANDTTRRTNDLRNKFFRPSYRWIYDDFEKSVLSPRGAIQIPFNILDDTYTNVVTNNNVINYVFNTGDKNVKAIEVCMEYVNKTNIWSNVQSVIILEKRTLFLQQKTHITPGTSGSDFAVTSFSAIPLVGTIVNVYLTLLPNTETLVGTYTVLTGDTLADVAAGVAADMVTKAIVLSPFATGSQVLYTWLNSVYSFSRVEIITTAPIDNIDFPYSFYNDSTYPDIIPEEAVQLFDYVPPFALCQGMPSGNILSYFGIREGYNKDTIQDTQIAVNTIAAGGNGNIGTLSVVLVSVINTLFRSFEEWVFSGVPAVGTIINIKLKRKSDHAIITVGTYTTVFGDTANTIVTKIVLSSDPGFFAGGTPSTATYSINIDPNIYEIATPPNVFSIMELVPPGASSTTNSFATWPWSTSRQIAIAYFDEHGVTAGIEFTDQVIFPEYSENVSNVPLLPFINYKIYHVPPKHAYSFGFYFTKDPTYYKWWVTNGINNDESEYIYLDVTSFKTNQLKHPTTANVLNYSFVDGDRLRFIRDIDVAGVVFNDTFDSAIDGLVIDPKVAGTPLTGEFLKIKNIPPFTAGIDKTKNYVIGIYRPGQQPANADNQTFYELGRNYPILDPNTSLRRHQGEVTTQVVGSVPAEFNFYEGDAFFRKRTISITDTGFAFFNIIDQNIVDFYTSAVNSIDGRPNIIDINAREAFYGAMGRFGQAYQANTNINGLGRFYGKNSVEYDYSFGNILRVIMRDRYMKVMQQYKIGVVPLFSSIGKDANSNTVIFQTDKLFNPIQYRVGNFGLGWATAVASFHFVDYFCDIRGDVCRDSDDGVISISQMYKMDSWAHENLPLRVNGLNVYLAFDHRLNNLIIHLEGKECAPVSVPDFTINNATAGTAFYQTVVLIGTLDFTLDNIVTPSWLSISISGYNLIFSGNPTNSDGGTDIPVSFDVINDCGVVSVSKTITVTAVACVAVTIQGPPLSDLPDGATGAPYNYSLNLGGTAPFTLTSIVKPSWMTIAIVGNVLSFSGTPSTSETNTPVSFTIHNCSSSTVDFNSQISVTGANWFISYTNNIGAVALTVYIGNNGGSPSHILYSGLYSSDPLSGTNLVDLPAVNAIVVLMVPGETIVSASCNGVPGLAGGSSVTWTGVNGGPLSISFITL